MARPSTSSSICTASPPESRSTPNGSAYVTGQVAANKPPTEGATIFGPQGARIATLFRLSAGGLPKRWETILGRSLESSGQGIAVDSTGAVYVTARTSSVDFPLVNPIQSSFGARPLWKSNAAGATWAPSTTGIAGRSVLSLAIDAQNSQVRQDPRSSSRPS